MTLADRANAYRSVIETSLRVFEFNLSRQSNVSPFKAPSLASLLLCVAASTAAAQSQAIDQKMKNVDGNRWFAGAYEITCERTAVQGVQMLTVYSVAKNDADALREARRNAVRAMIFRGVRSERCPPVEPLIRPDAFTAAADKYFDDFFKEGGPYLSYVEFAGDEVESRVMVGKQVKIGSAVAVQMTRLRTDLERAGIIQSMSDVFKRPPG